MKKIYRLLLIPLSLSMAACGYGLREIYPGNAYESGNFQKDYYKVWDERIDVNSNKNKIIRTEMHVLDDDTDYVFREYDDANFRLVDHDAYENLSYTSDYFPNDEDKYLDVGYGPTRKMGRIDDSFRYGYLSKLFDGQMFCHSRFQAARVQIDESGFGVLFDKETNFNTYFALNLKASYDYTKYNEADFTPYSTAEIPNVSECETGVNLKISFYCVENDGYVKKTMTYELDNLITNGHERTAIYTFFGFRTTNLELERVRGLSIEFDFDRDDITKNPYKDLKDKEGNPFELDYSLMLYELFMPNTIWR